MKPFTGMSLTKNLRVSHKKYYRRSFSVMVLASMTISSCITTSTSIYPPDDERPRESYKATGAKGMVTSAHPRATEAGLDMLKAGGNSIDAATATSFAISVLRPQSTGIGGGGFLLYYSPEKGPENVEVYDFRERAPLKASRDMFLDKKGNPMDYVINGVRIPNASINGHLSVGVPGLVAGLTEVHQKYGKLPLAQVMEPAIKLAEEGFPVYPALSKAIHYRMEIMQNFAGTRRIFLPDGKPLQPGEKLIQKDLARTLRLIAKNGRDGFYKGDVAEKLYKELKKGGIFSPQDLETYEVKMHPPVTGNYRGHKIVSMPPPSSGGTHIIQILNILSKDPIGQNPHNSPLNVHLLSEAMRRAYADRSKYLGDPAFVSVPIKGLTSVNYGQHLRSGIDEEKATPSRNLSAGNPAPWESASTTHISVVDQWGQAVSTTQTVNYTFGSCVVAEGTGVILNDEMDDFSIKPGVPNVFGLVGEEANAVAAKKTMLSSMSPTLVFDENRQLKLVVGSPGGSRIITATLQTIMNMIDFDMPLYDAVHANRIHHQWLPDEIRIEKDGLDPDTIAKLESMGHKIKVKGTPIGDIQAIARENHMWTGISDTRSDGQPMGY